MVNASVALGGIAGSLMLAPTNEYLGRRKAIMVSCVLYTIGAALEAGAMEFGMMVTGRLVLGVGIGIEVATVPIYVAEIVPRQHRGNLVSLYQFNITLGEVLGFAVAAIFINVSGNWRYILGSSLVFSTILLVGMIFLPESPRYLMHKGRPLDAFRVWKRVRGVESREAKEEFFIMMFSVKEEAAGKRSRGNYAWMDYFTVARCRRAMIYSLVMGALGQLTGINAVMYYMAVLLNQVGFDAKNSVFMSLVGGGTLMLGVIPAIIFIERRGRRFWAITMLPCFFVGLLIIGLGYLIPLSHVRAAQGVYLTGLIIYMFSFGIYATLSWIIPSEVYPTYLRSYGMTAYTAVAFVWIFIITYNFSRMLEAMSKIGLTLGFYGGIAVVGWLYQIFFMPETHHKTLEEVDLVFQKPTSETVRENAQIARETVNDLVHFRLRKVFLTPS
jgi:sugar porter (SP) family MFS transporter